MKQSRQENAIYLAVWGILFLAPLLSYYVRTVNDADISFDWMEILMVWQRFGLYLLLFLIHDLLLAPLLIHRQKRWIYFGAVAVIVVGFAVFQYRHHPQFHDRKHPMELRGERHIPPADRHMENPDGTPPAFRDRHHDFPAHKRPQPGLLGERDIVAIIVLVLMFAANLGIKNYFKSRLDHKKLLALEKENLEQQLEYLKYQINPHFFMNTLNNIHALVDIDPEKAKDTIVELSRMMRFVLYEGSKKTVPLRSELDFLDTYLQLMRLRYTNKVSISFLKPDRMPDAEVPPLMFITFVENAFKHGVSYKQPSFIDIKIEANSRQLTFACHNSKLPKNEDKHGGVGLRNVKQRLELIYGEQYKLDIDDRADTYNIRLVIPLS